MAKIKNIIFPILYIIFSLIIFSNGFLIWIPCRHGYYLGWYVQKCFPCPDHATCYSDIIHCDEGYELQFETCEEYE